MSRRKNEQARLAKRVAYHARRGTLWSMIGKIHNKALDEYLAAVHELGHAVVAAYLNIPLHSVFIRQDIGTPETLNGSCAASLTRGAVNFTVTDEATMVLAARVAEEQLALRNQVRLRNADDNPFEGDEQQLAELADIDGITDDAFAMWREECLTKARNIVAIPAVAATIDRLAPELFHERYLSGERVIEVLREQMATDTVTTMATGAAAGVAAA